jgi:hypothetical protein
VKIRGGVLLGLDKKQSGARKRKGHPATQAAFSSRENSSNGGKAVKTFCPNLMSRQTGVSRFFSSTNALFINHLQNQ